MRLGVTIFIILLVFGAIWFAFFYYLDVPQARLSFRAGAEGTILQGGPENLGGQAFILPVAETNYSPVRDFTIPEPVMGAKAAALYDVNSGRFLYSKDVNKRLPIASITKLMTAIVILDKLDLDDIYTVPAEAINVDGLGADLYKGEKLTGTNLLKIMLIKSSNDAALAFAAEAQKKGIDLISGMNEEARRIGMTNTYFSDPAGLGDGDAFSTPADLVKLVGRASDAKLLSEILVLPTAVVYSTDGATSHRLINTNQLLGKIASIIIGKTGYTDLALGTMVLEVSVNAGKDRLISVILGSNDRFAETKSLIDWALQAYSWE